MSVTPARRVAIEVVRRVREREAYGAQTLDAVLTGAGLSAEDAAFATRLARGTLAGIGTLDEALDRFLSKPRGVEPRVRDAMRVAAYELLYTASEPRAAVHQGVEAVRAVRPQAAGLANAVLRRLAEAASTFPWGDPETDLAALARLYAHPLWLVERLVRERGREKARTVLEADQEPAPLYLWHDPFRGEWDAAFASLAEDGAEPSPGPLPGSLVAGRPSAAVRSRAVRDGLVLVTDAAAQLAPRVTAPAPGSVTIDLTAGRGTKTAELQAAAVASGGPGKIYAVDLHPFKTEVLRERLSALAVPGVRVLTGDALDVESIGDMPAPHTADRVLLDAPCSGLGSLRRHPEARWRITPEQVGELAALQARLLVQAASLVRLGGVVVYSTCTVLREENDDVVRGFLESEHGSAFRIRSVAAQVPEAWSGYISEEGYFQSLPALGKPDGHFVAAFERTQD